MKNLVKLIGLIALMVAIGFSFVACKKDALDKTTWKASGNYDGYVLKFNSPNFSLFMIDEDGSGEVMDEKKGSYSISGNNIDLTFEEGAKTAATINSVTGDTLSVEGLKFTKQ